MLCTIKIILNYLLDKNVLRFIWISNNRVTLYRSIYRYYYVAILIDIFTEI